MIVEVIDWNYETRYYEISEADVQVMMLHPRKDRKELFKQGSKPAQIHCSGQVDLFIPVYSYDSDWDDHEKAINDYFLR